MNGKVVSASIYAHSLQELFPLQNMHGVEETGELGLQLLTRWPRSRTVWRCDGPCQGTGLALLALDNAFN